MSKLMNFNYKYIKSLIKIFNSKKFLFKNSLENKRHMGSKVNNKLNHINKNYLLRTFIRTDSLSFSRFTIFMATFFPVLI